MKESYSLSCCNCEAEKKGEFLCYSLEKNNLGRNFTLKTSIDPFLKEKKSFDLLAKFGSQVQTAKTQEYMYFY